MKMLLHVKDPISMEGYSQQVASATVLRVMHRYALPYARRYAPPSIAGEITVTPVTQTSGGFTAGLRAPGRARYVEYGTGIYAGGTPWEIYPRRRRALLAANGHFYKVVTVMGQKPKPFLMPAIKFARRRMKGAFVRAFSGGPSSRNR